MGAIKLTEISTVLPGGTVPLVIGDEARPLMASPLKKIKEYPEVQVHEPLFFNRQVFTKFAPAVISVSSGIVTSLTNCALSQGMGVAVGVGGTGVFVGRGVFVGGKGVLVGTTATGTVAVAAGEVGLGRMIGVPSAAWVCWAVKVCAAAVYMSSGPIVG